MAASNPTEPVYEVPDEGLLRGQEQTSCLGPDVTRFIGIQLFDQTAGTGTTGEFVAEEAGERGHAGATGASLSLRVVIGVGVDVAALPRCRRQW